MTCGNAVRTAPTMTLDDTQTSDCPYYFRTVIDSTATPITRADGLTRCSNSNAASFLAYL
jgi:hypothetical protein